MKTKPINRITRYAGIVVLSMISHRAGAQTNYVAIDLTPQASGAANASFQGQAAGFTGVVPNAFTGRATLWTGDGAIDLHPAFLSGSGARSVVNGFFGALQVGAGADAGTANRNVPLLWRDTAASAVKLAIPFTNAGGQANATDGVQIAGSAIGLDRDGTTLGSTHAVLWNVATGSATDLGTDANLLDVANGMQVGMLVKGSAQAALWRGTKSYVLLHPKGAVVSSASGTDGIRQAGYAGFDIRVRVEAAKGNKTKRFNYAYVWSGTVASGLNIHPYASNSDGIAFESSYATDVSGPWICGQATVPSKTGTPAFYRAVVWDASFSAVDLNAFVPEGFIGSQAMSVDAEGNVAGVMTKADGTRHAVLWVPLH